MNACWKQVAMIACLGLLAGLGSTAWAQGNASPPPFDTVPVPGKAGAFEHRFATGDAAGTVLTVRDDDDEGPAVAAFKNPNGPKVYIVTYHDGVDVDAATDDLKANHGLGETYRYQHGLRGAALLVPESDRSATLAHLQADPQVASVIADRTNSIELVLASPLKLKKKSPQTIPWGIRRVGATETSDEGEGVTVAVLDTGIDLDHPDLAANVNPALIADFVGDSITRHRPGTDGHGHGTAMAGIIAACDNTIGVVGIGSRIKLVSVRMCSRHSTFTTSTAAAALNWAVEHAGQINVANMSWRVRWPDPGESDLYHPLIQGLVSAGVVAVAGSGNDGVDLTVEEILPAKYEEVITVSNYYTTESTGDIAYSDSSNYGPGIVDIGAPGAEVLSTWLNGRYLAGGGTSPATAHVSGAAALYLRKHPDATPAEVRQTLIDNGENGYPGQDAINPATGLPWDPEPLLNVRGF